MQADTFFINFLYGLLSGIALSILTFFHKRLIRLFKSQFTENVRLGKKWYGILNFSNSTGEIRLTLKKNGYNIKGDLEFTSGNHKGKVYIIKGIFKDHILTLTYSPKDKMSTSQGSGTFKRVKDGQELHGYFSYFSQDSSEIGSIECKLRNY